MAKGSMPPQLVAYFKKKQGQEGDRDPSTNKKEAKANRKEALEKAKTHKSSRGKSSDAAGKAEKQNRNRRPGQS